MASISIPASGADFYELEELNSIATQGIASLNESQLCYQRTGEGEAT